MTIKELRILPPFAIGRLGSASEPVDNYRLEDDPDHPLGFRRIVPAETLIVDEATGEIADTRSPPAIEFKTEGKIRPVAPFLEVFAVTENDDLVPLTLDMIRRLDPKAEISWRVCVANRKIVRRTRAAKDLVLADTKFFSDHASHQLKGECAHFISREKFVDFGHVRFIKPNAKFPQIRLRFTPAKGLIYGPDLEKPDPVIPPERAIYDKAKDWFEFDTDKKSSVDQDAYPFSETLPPALYAISSPAPTWLHDNVATGRGYFDDACDGFVEVRLAFADGKHLDARARICAAPPALVPDSLFVRSLADDLEQVIYGPTVSDDEPLEVTRERAKDIVRRAYETVRFMNVAVMNGNNFKGRAALWLDSMPEEEAAGTQRAIRPVMGPGTVDTFAIMGLHGQVLAALEGGTAAWFARILRQPNEVADYTDRGRRKMPALMCGADNSYLALTYRQIDTIKKAAEQRPSRAKPPANEGLTPRNLTAHIHYEAAGNPISSRPITSVANCCPGLEVDFRAVWRRMFKGIVLREYDNLVVDVDPDCAPAIRKLKKHRLLRIFPPGNDEGIPVTAYIKGPASSDPDGEMILTTKANPAGLSPLEWSNALAFVLSGFQGKEVRCDFSEHQSWDTHVEWTDKPKNYISVNLPVRHFFEPHTAVISKALADAGELTQGLCSPWQNDYRECSCYYWASARPDYVNIEPGPSGLSRGDNWLQKARTGDYVPDDYVDSRLIIYDDLFLRWERWLRFQVGGRDAPNELPYDSGRDEI
ncbi:MAG: hypothetical protein NVS2B5_17130 [Beijerinckiaceae bacterium]